MLADKKIVIASYAHVMNNQFTKLGGPALALRDFLKVRVKKLVCYWQPLPISDKLDALAEIFEAGTLKTLRLPIPDLPGSREGIAFPYFALKLRDVVSVLCFAIRLRDRSDYFIGVEAINALLGVLLRRIGLASKVIYYNLDYGDVRFKSRILNFIFHALDQAAARHVDCIWNLSPEMAETRERKAGARPIRAPQITVPIGTDFERIERLPIDQIGKNQIVYLGLLSDNTGVSLVFDALPEIIRRMPDTRLIVVGSGPLEKSLRARVVELGLAQQVDFLGRVSDEMVEKTLCRCAVGIAPYAPDPESIKKFTDVTKPRMYLTCGLPVVITDVPPAAREIAENRAGIVIDYDKRELADAVVRILADDELFREFRQNAVTLASKYSWIDIFLRAFSETQNLIER